MNKSCLIAMMLALAGGTLLAQPAQEKVLLPVLLNQIPVPGDRGSRWVTSFWITNNADRPVLVAPYAFGCGVLICEQPPTPPGITFRPAHSALLPIPGVFMFVERGRADEVTFSLRVQDLSRQAETYGTELPVVREREWRPRIVLSDVPTSSRFRNLLRIYEFNGNAVVSVKVRIYGISEDRTDPIVEPLDPLLGETTIQLLPISAHYPSMQHPAGLFPAYAQIGDLSSIASLENHTRVRLEIEAASPSMIWAFVATTNNETQHVTIRSPQ